MRESYWRRLTLWGKVILAAESIALILVVLLCMAVVYAMGALLGGANG